MRDPILRCSRDGPRLLGGGAVLLDEGAVLLDEGTVLLDEGTALLDEGTVLLDAGTVLLEAGTVLLDEGTVLLRPCTGCLVPMAAMTGAGPALTELGRSRKWRGVAFSNGGLGLGCRGAFQSEGAARQSNGPPRIRTCGFPRAAAVDVYFL
jgi:hypothetical protein